MLAHSTVLHVCDLVRKHHKNVHLERQNLRGKWKLISGYIHVFARRGSAQVEPLKPDCGARKTLGSR